MADHVVEKDPKEWEIISITIKKPKRSLGIELEWQKAGMINKSGAFRIKKVVNKAPAEVKTKIKVDDELVSINSTEPRTLKLLQTTMADTPVGGSLTFEVLRKKRQRNLRNILHLLPTATGLVKTRLQVLLDYGVMLEDLTLIKANVMGMKLEVGTNTVIDMIQIREITHEAPQEVKEKIQVNTWMVQLSEEQPSPFGVPIGKTMYMTLLHPHGSFPDLEGVPPPSAKKYSNLTNKELFALEESEFSDPEAMAKLKRSRLEDDPEAESQVASLGQKSLQQAVRGAMQKLNSTRSKRPKVEARPPEPTHKYGFFENEHLFVLEPSAVSDSESFQYLREERLRENPKARTEVNQHLRTEAQRISARNEALILLNRARRERKRKNRKRPYQDQPPQQCPYCGRLFSKGFYMHRAYCKQNPERIEGEEEEGSDEDALLQPGVEVLSPQEKWDIYSKREESERAAKAKEMEARKQEKIRKKQGEKPTTKKTNALGMFIEEKRKQYKEQHMDFEMEQIKMLWQLLCPEEKAEYKKRAAEHNSKVPTTPRKSKNAKADNRNAIVDAFLDTTILDV